MRPVHKLTSAGTPGDGAFTTTRDGREGRCLAVRNLSNIQHRAWGVVLGPRSNPGLIGGIKDLLYNTLVNLHTEKKKHLLLVKISSNEGADVLSSQEDIAFLHPSMI